MTNRITMEITWPNSIIRDLVKYIHLFYEKLYPAQSITIEISIETECLYEVCAIIDVTTHMGGLETNLTLYMGMRPLASWSHSEAKPPPVGYDDEKYGPLSSHYADCHVTKAKSCIIWPKEGSFKFKLSPELYNKICHEAKKAIDEYLEAN
jgi:hypothetical protein